MPEQTMDFVTVVEELAAARGIDSLEELVERVNARSESGRKLSVKELRSGPRSGYGTGLDRVLNLSEQEKARVSVAFMRTFWSG